MHTAPVDLVSRAALLGHPPPQTLSAPVAASAGRLRAVGRHRAALLHKLCVAELRSRHMLEDGVTCGLEFAGYRRAHRARIAADNRAIRRAIAAAARGEDVTGAAQ